MSNLPQSKFDGTRLTLQLPNLNAVDAADVLEALGQVIHRLNEKWWRSLDTGERINRNVGEMLMLTVCELAEGMEGARKGMKDDHLPHRPMLEVELADAIIRILDTGYGLGLDVGGALVEKLIYNTKRKDHTEEARRAEGGKKV
jgi:hypothetical protein